MEAENLAQSTRDRRPLPVDGCTRGQLCRPVCGCVEVCTEDDKRYGDRTAACLVDRRMWAPGETMLTPERLHVQNIHRDYIWECPQNQNIEESSTCQRYRERAAERLEDGCSFRCAQNNQGPVRRDDPRAISFLYLRCHRLVS